MRRKPLMATVLLSAVVGTLLALLAPSAAGSESDSEGSPSNRGWVAGSQHDSGDSGDSDSGDSDSDD